MMNDAVIRDALEYGATNQDLFEDVLKKAINRELWEDECLSLEEAAILLNPVDVQELFRAADMVRKAVYGERILIITPVYAANSCMYNCNCNLGRNSRKSRHVLSSEEIRSCAEHVKQEGAKRVLLIFKPNPDVTSEYINAAVNVFRKAGIGCDVEAPLYDLHDTGAYVHVQGVYSRELYERVFEKSYDKTFSSLEDAVKEGVDDYFISIWLFGDGDYRYEVLGAIYHASYMLEKYGVGPRAFILRNAGIPDSDFARAIAVLKLAVPYAGIATTDLFSGTSIMLTRPHPQNVTTEFDEKVYSLKECIEMLVNRNTPVSFCSACYHNGRTGPVFMALARRAVINKRCTVNAIASMIEYLTDADLDENVRSNGYEIIKELRSRINEPRALKWLEMAVDEIRRGKRGLRL